MKNFLCLINMKKVSTSLGKNFTCLIFWQFPSLHRKKQFALANADAAFACIFPHGQYRPWRTIEVGNLKEYRLFSGANLREPAFNGDGYMRIPIPEASPLRHVTSVSFEMKTNATEGIIFWIGEVRGSCKRGGGAGGGGVSWAMFLHTGKYLVCVWDIPISRN